VCERELEQVCVRERTGAGVCERELEQVCVRENWSRCVCERTGAGFPPFSLPPPSPCRAVRARARSLSMIHMRVVAPRARALYLTIHMIHVCLRVCVFVFV